MLRNIMFCYVMLCYVMVWSDMAWYGMACHGMVWSGLVWSGLGCYVVLCYVVRFYAVTCHATYVCICTCMLRTRTFAQPEELIGDGSERLLGRLEDIGKDPGGDKTCGLWGAAASSSYYFRCWLSPRQSSRFCGVTLARASGRPEDGPWKILVENILVEKSAVRPVRTSSEFRRASLLSNGSKHCVGKRVLRANQY